MDRPPNYDQAIRNPTIPMVSTELVQNGRSNGEPPRNTSFRQGQSPNQRWKPPTSHPVFLLSLISLSITLIVALQLFLVRSRRDGGLLFAPNINDLPLAATFPYLYLPTIIAVVYGFAWAWIDLDVRRLEPFYQLTNENGVSGKASLLLHYPVDFLASVPIKAVKYRHWPVFSASIATVLVFWGLTPLQAGIFATDTINRTFAIPMAKSTGYLSLSEQKDTLSAQSVYSATNILWLNESLPAYMTRDFILAPFGPAAQSHQQTPGVDETWTGVTQRYGVNTTCETPIPWESNGQKKINSTWGCHFILPTVRTIEDYSNSSKIFDTLYIGYSNDDGSADYYLGDGTSCPKNESQSFILQWSKALINGTAFNNLEPADRRNHANVTNRWCRSTYYVQDVTATIALPQKSVLDYKTMGDPRLLPSDIFNASDFEAAMSLGHERFNQRSEFPTSKWPNQQSFLLDMPLNLQYLPKMTPFAIGATQKPLDDYLDPSVLDDSYQAAYRILFARQMVNVLSTSLNSSATVMGEQRYVTQAIIVVPAFAYVVEVFLGVIIMLATTLLYTSFRRPLNLKSDPATISATMSLIADDEQLLSRFSRRDRASNQELEDDFALETFQMLPVDDSPSGFRLALHQDGNEHQNVQDNQAERSEGGGFVKGVQPLEFKLKTGAMFFGLQVGLFALIPALYWQIGARNGLTLPSQKQFVRQLLENYLPTAIGTFIEPFWMVLNRHLCLLQPFEALRKGNKTAKDSTDLDYASFPPQFVIWNAFRRGHILLAAVCCMTLLANVLSVALSGLFFENTVLGLKHMRFSTPYNLHLVSLNGSGPPFIANKGGVLEPFYIAVSNLTAQTPMPPWTDDRFFYLPFKSNSTLQNDTWTYRATTPVLGANLTCQDFPSGSEFMVTPTVQDPAANSTLIGFSNLTIALINDQGFPVTCVPRIQYQYITGSTGGPAAYEFNLPLTGLRDASSVDVGFCMEHVTAGWVRAMTVNHPEPSGFQYPPRFNISSLASTITVCRARLETGLADVLVSADGHVQKRLSFMPSNGSIDSLFTTNQSDLLGQVHQFTFDAGMTWHTDSLPSDFNNYLIKQCTNSSRLFDVNQPIPSLQDAIPPFSALYSKLFAILMGRNMDRLFERSDNTMVDGVVSHSTTRIFMSKGMFVIAEVILLLYIFVTICLYIRRPWKILARMPHTPASIIAFVAAGHAVKDFQQTARMDSEERRQHLQKLDHRYGFGTFIGTDSKTHVGIEKHPFLAPFTREQSGLSLRSTSFKRKETADSSISRWRFLEWKSGKIREGGYI